MPKFDPHELHLQVKKTIDSREYDISPDFSWQYKFLSQASTTITIFHIGFSLRCAGFKAQIAGMVTKNTCICCWVLLNKDLSQCCCNELNSPNTAFKEFVCVCRCTLAHTSWRWC